MQVEAIKERSMVKYVLLHIFTLGLYDLYFYYRLSLDVDAVCEGDGLESPNYLVAVLLSAFTFGLYFWYWLYKVGQRLHVNTPRYGFKMMETGRDFLVLNIASAGYFSAYEFIKNMNKVALVYNENGPMLA